MYCLARRHAARGGSQKRYTQCRGWIAICVSHYRFLPRDAMYSADYAVARCLLTVCPSVCHTPVLCRNGELFSPPSSHTILHVVLPHLTLRQYIDGNIPSGRGGASMQWGLKQKAQLSQRERAMFVLLNISLSHSRSFEMAPFESLGMVSYSPSIVGLVAWHSW